MLWHLKAQGQINKSKERFSSHTIRNSSKKLSYSQKKPQNQKRFTVERKYSDKKPTATKNHSNYYQWTRKLSQKGGKRSSIMKFKKSKRQSAQFDKKLKPEDKLDF